MDNKEKLSGAFKSFKSKASDFEKKATDEIQKGSKKALDWGKKAASEVQRNAKDFSEQTEKTLYEQRVKKYNPLFKEKFFDDNFHLPNVIQIVDDAVRRDVDVCEGAIGWTKKLNDVEVLFLYDEFVKESKITFIPFAHCDKTYCVDVFNKNRYIASDVIFERANDKKTAELENILYCLGAKKYYIEMVYSNVETSQTQFGTGVNTDTISGKIQHNSNTTATSFSSGKNFTYLTGNDTLQRPKLKWFKYDENINNLIKMRLSEDNHLKHKELKIQGTATEVVTKNVALAVDSLQNIKGNTGMHSRFTTERNTLMIIEVDF